MKKNLYLCSLLSLSLLFAAINIFGQQNTQPKWPLAPNNTSLRTLIATLPDVAGKKIRVLL